MALLSASVFAAGVAAGDFVVHSAGPASSGDPVAAAPQVIHKRTVRRVHLPAVATSGGGSGGARGSAAVMAPNPAPAPMPVSSRTSPGTGTAGGSGESESEGERGD